MENYDFYFSFCSNSLNENCRCNKMIYEWMGHNKVKRMTKNEFLWEFVATLDTISGKFHKKY